MDDAPPDFHDPARFPPGFRCASVHCGLKREGRDLSLFAADTECAAAAVFTRNHVAGAPVILGRETLRAGRLQAVVVNSKVSNVGTGPEGVERARRMARAAGRELGIGEDRVLVSSTGVIGVPLPIERIEKGLQGMRRLLQADPMEGALGIMTTDTHPKALSLPVGPATLTAVAKGSGMIAPNMATMLCYLFTDAELEAGVLDRILRKVVDRTFNMLSVDGDTSTSDSCAILASGSAGPVDEARFAGALLELCTRMTETLARDGEGASRLYRVTVTGAASMEDARAVTRSLLNSPLMKTMIHGGDPNIGRILMAVGKCVDCRIDAGRIAARIGATPVIEGGRRADFEDELVRTLLMTDPVDLSVDLGLGGARSRGWGCDLTPGYIEENAAYTSS